MKMKKIYSTPSATTYKVNISSVLQNASDPTPENGGSGTPGAIGQSKRLTIFDLWEDQNDED